ncbi:hypothetical protein ACQ4PT_008263 [Festuca glaucescens]
MCHHTLPHPFSFFHGSSPSSSQSPDRSNPTSRWFFFFSILKAQEHPDAPSCFLLRTAEDRELHVASETDELSRFPPIKPTGASPATLVPFPSNPAATLFPSSSATNTRTAGVSPPPSHSFRRAYAGHAAVAGHRLYRTVELAQNFLKLELNLRPPDVKARLRPPLPSSSTSKDIPVGRFSPFRFPGLSPVMRAVIRLACPALPFHARVRRSPSPYPPCAVRASTSPDAAERLRADVLDAARLSPDLVAKPCETPRVSTSGRFIPPPPPR